MAFACYVRCQMHLAILCLVPYIQSHLDKIEDTVWIRKEYDILTECTSREMATAKQVIWKVHAVRIYRKTALWSLIRNGAIIY